MQLAPVTRDTGKTERQRSPVALVTNEHITEACQAISKLPQGLIGHNHYRPYTAVLEVCHLQLSVLELCNAMTPLRCNCNCYLIHLQPYSSGS